MNRKEIEDILKDYSWMINSIKLLRSSMKDAGENMTAQYGDEAGMPKPQGGNQSDPVFQEVKRREKRWGVVYKYEKKVQVIQSRMHIIVDQREIEVLHWLLEGKSVRWIGRHMGLSHTNVQRLREAIVTEITKVPNVPKVPKYSKETTCV